MEKRPTVVRPEKAAVVEELADRLSRSTMAILADYRGLTVAQMSDLRRQLRAAEVDFKVTKNTLTRLAAQRSGRESLLPALVGPTAIAFGYGDPIVAAKVITDTIRTQRLSMQIKSAFMGDRLLPAGDVSRLAELPGRDTLIAQAVGTMQAPIVGLVSVLAATLQSLLGVLEARRQQLESADAT